MPRFIFLFLAAVLFFLSVSCHSKSLYQSLESNVVADFSSNEETYEIRFLGNTNILISDGETAILTDGYFTRNGMVPTILRAETNRHQVIGALELAGVRVLKGSELPRHESSNTVALDFVIPLHHHFDHVMDVPTVAALSGANVVGTEATLNVLRGAQRPNTDIPRFRCQDLVEGTAVNSRNVFIEVGINKDEHFALCRLGKFDVRFFRSKHFSNITEPKGENEREVRQPKPATHFKTGDVWILQVTHTELSGNLLIIGSSGELEKQFRFDGLITGVDYVFVAVPGFVKNGDEIFEKIFSRVNPRYLVPIHWDSLFKYKKDEVLQLEGQSFFANLIGQNKRGIDKMCELSLQWPSLKLILLETAKPYPAKPHSEDKIANGCPNR